MKDNVFLEDQKKFGLADYMNFDINGREHMGSTVPLAVYRLLEYSVREELTERFGREIQADIFAVPAEEQAVFLRKPCWI